MTEVFRTDVNSDSAAKKIVEAIHANFNECAANFDLQDCDHVLRVHCKEREVNCEAIISIVSTFGYHADILPDEVFDLPLTLEERN